MYSRTQFLASEIKTLQDTVRALASQLEQKESAPKDLGSGSEDQGFRRIRKQTIYSGQVLISHIVFAAFGGHPSTCYNGQDDSRDLASVSPMRSPNDMLDSNTHQVWAQTGGIVYGPDESSGPLDDLATVTPMGKMVEETEARRHDLERALADLSKDSNQRKRKQRDWQLTDEPLATSSGLSINQSVPEALARQIFAL